MTKSEYNGQHREIEPQDVINAALRVALAEAMEQRGTAVLTDIDRAPADVRAVIYGAMEG